MHNPATPMTVVFDVFTDADEAAVASALGFDSSRLDSLRLSRTLEQTAAAAECLRNADAIVVTGGAGMSAAAGVDYNDEELYAKYFPNMLKFGYTCMYDHLGPSRGASQEEIWGYLARQVIMILISFN